MIPTFFSGLQWSDLGFLFEAALNTCLISIVSISIGSFLGLIFGWIIEETPFYIGKLVSAALDIFRSVPIVIQLVIFYNLFPIIGFRLDPMIAGCFVLTIYMASLVSNIVVGGIQSVPKSLRKASRSLGLSYFQDMRYIVLPVGFRSVSTSWIGVCLGVLKDSSLVSVIGVVELLRASEILTTRTQEPLLILAIVGAFYFVISYAVSFLGDRLEKRYES